MFDNYNAAFRSIMNSNMYAEAKTKAIELLMTGYDRTYYKSVIKIAKSYMSSVDKLKTIATLNSKFEK